MRNTFTFFRSAALALALCPLLGFAEGSSWLNFHYAMYNDGAYLTRYLRNDPNVVVPDYVDGKMVRGFVGECFRDKNITSVIIPSTVLFVGERCFLNCTNLKSVIIKDGVKGIGRLAFEGCTSLETVTLPQSIEWMGEECFKGCSNLKFEITANNKVLEETDFRDYDGARLYVDLADEVTELKPRSFKNCNALVSVTMKNGLKSIGASCFSGCVRLKDVLIPESVTTIGKKAFQGCKSISSIRIPKGVSSIGAYCFQGCFGLEAVLVDRPTPPELAGHFGFAKDGGPDQLRPVVYVPKGSVDAYKRHSVWGQYDVRPADSYMPASAGR